MHIFIGVLPEGWENSSCFNDNTARPLGAGITGKREAELTLFINLTEKSYLFTRQLINEPLKQQPPM